MSGFLPTVGEKPPPLHSLVAWPPEALDTWAARCRSGDVANALIHRLY